MHKIISVARRGPCWSAPPNPIAGGEGSSLALPNNPFSYSCSRPCMALLLIRKIILYPSFTHRTGSQKINTMDYIFHRRHEIPVDGVGVVLIEIVDSLVKLGTALRLLDRQAVEVRVGIQCKLVHRVDRSHVVQHEEQDGSTLGTRTITLQQTYPHPHPCTVHRASTATHTHNWFMALWILSGTTWVSRYQKKHSHTHTYHGPIGEVSCYSNAGWRLNDPCCHCHYYSSLRF